jgi:hypothetical protein
METVTLKKSRVRFHWHDGATQDGEGLGNDQFEIAADAANKLGYGSGAIKALDYFELIEDDGK